MGLQRAGSASSAVWVVVTGYKGEELEGGSPSGEGRPPTPVIFESLAEPPARILASRRSRRMRACSEATEGVDGDDFGLADGDGAEGGVSMVCNNSEERMRLLLLV